MFLSVFFLIILSSAGAIWFCRQAISEAREAARLGPNDPRTHLALGLAFARGGQKEEARSELDKAAELAKADVRFRNQEVWARRELKRLGF